MQIIVLSTDGVWEAHNSDGEIFGKTRLYEIIRGNANKKAQEIIETVFVALNQFQNNSKTEDDITLVVVKIDTDLEKSDGVYSLISFDFFSINAAFVMKHPPKS